MNNERIQALIREKMDNFSIDRCTMCGMSGIGTDILKHLNSPHHIGVVNAVKQLVKDTELHHDVCGDCPAIITTDELAWCQLGTHRYSHNEWRTNLFGYRRGDRVWEAYPDLDKEFDLSWDIIALRGRTCFKVFGRKGVYSGY